MINQDRKASIRLRIKLRYGCDEVIYAAHGFNDNAELS
jgi:hypothetical protein